MAEKKIDNKGGIPNIYWRYIATLLVVSAFIYVWCGIFNGNTPARPTMNYSQFIEQLSAGNIKSVSIKKELLSGELVKDAGILLPGEKNPRR